MLHAGTPAAEHADTSTPSTTTPPVYTIRGGVRVETKHLTSAIM